MGIEGSLNIQLKVGNGIADPVSIESSRPVHASRVFHGKSIAESQKLLPILFNVCGTAQSCAGVRACEQALGVQASAQTERLRDALVNMETLREHLWRILLDWPCFIGGEADKAGMAEMVAIQRDYRHALCPGGDPFRLGGADCRTEFEALGAIADRAGALLQRTVFAMSPGAWLALTGQPGFMAWAEARQTIAAELIDQVVQAGWGHAGACESRALPPLTGEALHKAMQDVDYVKQPRWSGHCCETSSLTRVDSPLLKALKQEYSNGLLVRLVARLTEIAYLAGRLKLESQDSPGDKGSSTMPVNPGIGQAAAARGQLVHRVGLNGDAIGSYQILAPTEWNFHPKGVVAQALSALTGDPGSVEKQARLLINAIDPCVGYELNVVQGSPANA
jgi:Ni,Fe-hydrogenase I large subunit